MSNHSVQAASTSGDKLKIAASVALSLVAIFLFYFFSEKATLIRGAILIFGLLGAVACIWTSSVGRSGADFARDSIRETKKVVWPPRNDAMRITAVVFGFVLVMALFLWGADKVLEFVLYDVILGWKK